ncbi:hypothetical protein [Amycolatopsis samaneae]|uniref:Uncharacterized protein n=1 Tax=Amycolatopsis samaneae TaxID=664691 RepID=A0ABW5GBT1_9PSEU
MEVSPTTPDPPPLGQPPVFTPDQPASGDVTNDLAERLVPWTTRTTQLILDAARSGGFRVDAGFAAVLIGCLQDIEEELRKLEQRTAVLRERSPLGHTETAIALTDMLVAGATDEQGMLTQLSRAADEVKKFADALDLAKRRFTGHEQDVVDVLRRRHSGLFQ